MADNESLNSDIEFQGEDNNVIESYQEKFSDACNVFYGICRPSNLKIGYLKFLDLVQSGQGHTESMLMISECFMHGKGVDTNEDLALAWLEKAAIEHKNPVAKGRYASYFLDKMSSNHENTSRSSPNSNTMKLSYDDALKLLAEAAEEGSIEAETKLGALLEKAGEFEDAFKWFTLSASHGCPNSTNMLGLLYFHGKGVIQQPETAFRHFITSASFGCADAYCNAGVCFERGIGTEKNINDAMKYYHLGASRGSGQAMYSLGFILSKKSISMHDKILRSSKDGGSGRQKSKNAELLRRFMKGGLLPAESLTADCDPSTDYFEVNIVSKAGAVWLRKASEHGVVDAGFQLGQMYEQGLAGFPVDLKAAYSQYLWAANRDHIKANYFVGNMLYSGVGTSTPPDYTSACIRYRQAAQSDHAPAMNALALLLEDGLGDADHLSQPMEAVVWYWEACSATAEPYEEAAVNLAMLLTRCFRHAHVNANGNANSDFTMRSGNVLSMAEVRSWLEENYPITEEIFRTAETLGPQYSNYEPIEMQIRRGHGGGQGEEKDSRDEKSGHNITRALAIDVDCGYENSNDFKSYGNSNINGIQSRGQSPSPRAQGSASNTVNKGKGKGIDKSKSKGHERVDGVIPPAYVPRASRVFSPTSDLKSPLKKQQTRFS